MYRLENDAPSSFVGIYLKFSQLLENNARHNLSELSSALT